jgi:hypothetical protein
MEINRRMGIAIPGAVFTLILCLTALSPYGVAQIFSEDLTMQSTETSSGMMGRGGGTNTSTDYYSRNALRSNTSTGIDTIIQFDSEKIITIDNKKKTYTEMTFEQLSEMLDNAASQLNENSEEMAAAMKMMGIGDTPISVSKAGPGETIAGFPTDKYIIKGFMNMEIMASPDLKIPAAYYDVMKMRVPSMPMMDLKQLFEEMKKIDGIPLKTVMSIKMMNMEMKTTKEVTSIERGAIPASVFNVPADYKKVEPNLN